MLRREGERGSRRERQEGQVWEEIGKDLVQRAGYIELLSF